MTNKLLHSAIATEAMSTLELDCQKITFLDLYAIRYYIVCVAYLTDLFTILVSRCLLFDVFLNFGSRFLDLLLEFQNQSLSQRVGLYCWRAISLSYLRI